MAWSKFLAASNPIGFTRAASWPSLPKGAPGYHIPPLGLTPFRDTVLPDRTSRGPADQFPNAEAELNPAGSDFLHKCEVLRWVCPMWGSRKGSGPLL
jgi:hypothetical protein